MSFESQRNEEISLLERHDLLTGEPRYIEDEIRNSGFSTTFGGIATLACLVAAILAWILYNRDRTRISLWHAIMCTLGFLFGLAICSWGAGAAKTIRHGNAANPMMTLIAMVGALIGAVYFISATLSFALHKPNHLCKITGWRGSQSEWNRHMPDAWSLDKAWTRDNRIINWLIALSAIAAFCFVLSSSDG